MFLQVVSNIGGVGGDDAGGVTLSWQDIWVSASQTKGGGSDGGGCIPILHGLTGIANPGEVLAVMGPSGCGKSVLLDTLAGRLGSNMNQRGEILVNGQKQKLAFGTSAYVTQDEVLMTTLTVREAVYYSAHLQLPDDMPASEKRARAEATMREMGLASAMDTRIGGGGGASTKGISGGQRRRVSICMEILTRPRLLFLDEPTSGLDSAASYHVMSRITRLAEREGMTVVAAVHQPTTEVFALFQSLCLLAYGKTVFFGPTSLTNEFFAMNGFPCPSLSNPSDHYLRTINKDFDTDIEEGSESKPLSTAEAIDILVNSFASSTNSHIVLQHIAEMHKSGGAALVKKSDQAGFLNQCIFLTKRSFTNMNKDLGYYWLRFVIYIALCLCVGTVYYNAGRSFSISSIQARGSMLLYTTAFLTFMAIGGFPSFLEDMKIFQRERLNGHYWVAPFVIANTLSATPYLILISLVPGSIAYYLVGLQRTASHFAYFALVLLMCMMLVESLMMIVASLVPDYLMGIIAGAGVQGVMMLGGGFFQLHHDLPRPVWQYPLHYVSFHKYANQGFYKNEFLGLTFPAGYNINQAAAAAAAGGGGGGGRAEVVVMMNSGEEILKERWQIELGYSKWIDLAVLAGMVIVYRLLFLVVVKIGEKYKPKVQACLSRIKKSAYVVAQASPKSSP